MPAALVAGFEGAEAPLQFPLLLGFFAGFEEGSAGSGGFFGAQEFGGTCGDGASENIWLAPETGAGQKIVFEAGAN